MRTELYLGLNEIERPVYLSTLAQSMHTQVIGATGVGKTESALLPIALSDLARGHSIIFIDPKGDASTYETLKDLCSFIKRSADLIKIDLAHPDENSKYNPLKIGSPTELKDKIVGSIIWTEEYYKKVAERSLLNIFNFFKSIKYRTSMADVCNFLSDPEKFKIPLDYPSDEESALHTNLVGHIKTNREDLAGIISDLVLWCESEFSSIIIDCDAPSVHDWIVDKKIVYINLNTLAFEESSRRFGRLIIQDIKTAVQRLQGVAPDQRPTTSIIIDEFAAVASSGFIELLNKARSANVRLTLAHQSQGDLTAISPSFANQILDNTNLKIIFRIDSPETSDFYSRMIGTRLSHKETLQISSNSVLGTSKTGTGSTRSTEEFIVSPNLLRSLGRGESIVLSKIPYAVNKCHMRPIKEWIYEFEQNENQRRSKWPSYGKTVLF